MRTKAVIGFAFVALLVAQQLRADSTDATVIYDREAALQASQAAIGMQIGDYAFRNTRGQQMKLQELGGKPLVVSLIYTSCHHVCPMITRNVEEKVAIAREAFGEDQFNVVTIGFDWQVDTAEQMRVYASSRGIDEANWYFLSGDARSVEGIANDLGFHFAASAKGFDHLSQTTVVDASGTVYRQVYGQDFDAPALIEPLKELVFDTPRTAGIIEHWVDTFKFFCTVYDPNSGRYLFDYSILMTIFVGVLCLGGILTFIVREWRQTT
ncbi:MAG: SCO family protein [Woeseiaceae bacterium]